MQTRKKSEIEVTADEADATEDYDFDEDPDDLDDLNDLENLDDLDDLDDLDYLDDDDDIEFLDEDEQIKKAIDYNNLTHICVVIVVDSFCIILLL